MERLPTPKDDWSQVYTVIHTLVNDWLGKTKMLAEPVRRDGDVSLMPRSDEKYDERTGDYKKPSTWCDQDLLSDLMDGSTGNTIATYISGMGLRSEKIGDVLQDKVQDAIEDLFLEVNSVDASERSNFDFELYHDDLREMAYDVLDDMKNYTLESVINETKGEG